MKAICPLNGQYQTSSFIYQAAMKKEDNNEDETYTGLTENTFKSSFHRHKHSFKNPNNKNATTLSQYILKLKDKGIRYSSKW